MSIEYRTYCTPANLVVPPEARRLSPSEDATIRINNEQKTSSFTFFPTDYVIEVPPNGRT
jgi:hypothetical protein